MISFGCKSTALKGVRHASPGLQQIKVTCSESQLSTTKVQNVKGMNNKRISIEGQICLSGEVTTMEGEANIVFIVDTSNSMAYADPTTGWISDCERKKAIQKVVSLTTGGNSTVGSKLKGAIVTFGSYATTSGWKSLSSLSYAGVCGSYGGTNYEGAFKKAESLLKGKSGTNIIYFITDGAPSMTNSSTAYSGNDWSGGRTQGAYAMQNLKNSVDNLTVNAIYLEDPKLGSSDYGVDCPTKQQTHEYLVDIVGSSSHVKLASNASSLVEQISAFDTVPAGSFASTSDLKAQVTVSGVSSNVKVKSLTYTSEGVYTYKLEEVTLKGTVGSTVDNKFVVQGTGSNGEVSTSTVIIKYTRTN